jgi:CRP-like cAMP-binding protein
LNNAAPDGWLSHFPALAAAPEAERRRLFATAQALRVPAGTTVFRPGDVCQNYLMVIEGSVRVQIVGYSYIGVNCRSQSAHFALSLLIWSQVTTIFPDDPIASLAFRLSSLAKPSIRAGRLHPFAVSYLCAQRV